MPNTDIAARLDESVVTLEIKIPVLEFVLSFAETEKVTSENLLAESREKIAEYFRKHLVILSKQRIGQNYNITFLRLETSSDEFVSEYQELIAAFEIPVKEEFNPRDFTLVYIAVTHQVPNHFALVKITQDFSSRVIDENKGMPVGAIRYDFSTDSVPPLAINVNDGGIFTGFRAIVSLGMHHIWVGLDHILFLLTLLIVAPLAVKNGK